MSKTEQKKAVLNSRIVVAWQLFALIEWKITYSARVLSKL